MREPQVVYKLGATMLEIKPQSDGVDLLIVNINYKTWHSIPSKLNMGQVAELFIVLKKYISEVAKWLKENIDTDNNLEQLISRAESGDLTLNEAILLLDIASETRPRRRIPIAEPIPILS